MLGLKTTGNQLLLVEVTDTCVLRVVILEPRISFQTLKLMRVLHGVRRLSKEELISRRLESKHYWFPLPDKDIYLYEGFPQNPGW